MSRSIDRRSVRRPLTASAFVLIAISALSSSATGAGTVALQGCGSDVFDRLGDSYHFGVGFNFLGTYQVAPKWDVRGDFGVRFLEGEQIPQSELGEESPDLRAIPGERTDGLRIMPFTLDIVRRFEELSKGRYWVPYAAAGIGLYDMQARYLPADPDAGVGQPDDEIVRKANIFEFGWNAKMGVNMHRTSGLFINLESGLHLINTARRWTPTYDLSLGVGTILPVR